MIIEMLRMIWFSICWIWCIPSCLKLIKLISENLSNINQQLGNQVFDNWHIFKMIWETKAVSLRTEVILSEILFRKFLCLSFWLTAQCSPFWVSLWKLLWSGGRTTTRQSRLHRNSFSKSSLRLTLSHSSPRVQITTAAPTLRRRSKRAGCLSIHRELPRRRRKGAAEPVEEGSCAARRTLSFSLSVLSHTCWLSIRWMSQRTERILWFDLTMDPQGYMLCKINILKGRVEVTSQFHRKLRERQNKCKACSVKQEMILKYFFLQKKLKKASWPQPISHYGKRCLIKMFIDNS